MVESLFIFGNGLGRSIDPAFFDLKPALEHAWTTEGCLTATQKNLIRACLPEEVLEDENADAPQSEEQLEELQHILSACDTIAKTEQRVGADSEEGWLSAHGREFPTAIRRYLHHAACYFLERDILLFDDKPTNLDDEFVNILNEFILKSGAHVATLNYDDLLYEAFCDTDVFKKFRLRDGFFRKGRFDFEMAERNYAARQEGWFLHLHGSPLFLDQNGEPRKVTRAEIRANHGSESTHLVLTSVKFKRTIIQGSEILNRYWKKFREIVPTSENIILFGYGGWDTHLNQALKFYAPKGSIRIVEHRNDRTDEERKAFWEDALHLDDFTIIRLENIQDFRAWAK